LLRIWTGVGHLWMWYWNFGFHKMRGNFLTSWEPVSFSRTTLLNGVRTYNTELNKNDTDLARNRQHLRPWLKEKRLTPLLLYSHQKSSLNYRSRVTSQFYEFGMVTKIREQFRCPATYHVSCGTAHLWAKGRKKSNDRAQKTSEFQPKPHVIWRSMIDCFSNLVINRHSVLISLHCNPKFLLFKDSPHFGVRQGFLSK